MKCGIGDYTHHLAQALSEAPEVRVGVLTDRRAGAGLPDRRFELLPSVRTWTFPELGPLLGSIRRWNPDVVHLQFPTQGYGDHVMPWFLPWILRAGGRRVAQTWHEYSPMGHWRSLPLSLAAGGLVAVRPAYLERMPRIYRWLNRNKSFQFIPNACTLPRVELSGEERRELRARLGASTVPLLTYFGFAYPAKGIESLFQIADPTRHRLLLICDLDPADAYHRSILDQVGRPPWRERATVIGFQPAPELARILAASDAILLPFREGGGPWNSSLHGAAAQGTFILTTSRERLGFQPENNVYYAAPGDFAGMRRALEEHGGRRNPHGAGAYTATWSQIASSHLELYRRLQR